MEFLDELAQNRAIRVVDDELENPDHYKRGGRECIEFVEAALGKDGFQAFCLGNVMKYVWRQGDAGGAKDIRKAKRYLEYWLVAEEG